MEHSLIILETLISRPRNGKTIRLTDLIAVFTEGYASNWHFCVPKFYSDALDIRFTDRKVEKQKLKLWTQESYFNFSIGDTFYNHPYAYCDNFKRTLSSLRKLCFQVESAAPSIPQFEDIPRQPGQVNFKIFEFQNHWRVIGNKSLSQDAFIKLLIKGFDEII